MTLDELRQWCLVLPLDDYVGPTVVALIDSHQALLAVLEVCKPPTGWPDTEQWTAQREAALAAADALTRGDTP